MEARHFSGVSVHGDSDETYEFKMSFADLCAECDQMWEDLHQEWVPKCFDIFFVAAGLGDEFGGLLGYDTYEQDYFGIGCSDSFAEDEAKKILKQLTKDELIAATRQCFKVYNAFMGLSIRYDSLKAAIDILRDKNTGVLQVVRQIDELYDKMEQKRDIFFGYSEEYKLFNKYTEALPPEAWIA